MCVKKLTVKSRFMLPMQQTRAKVCGLGPICCSPLSVCIYITRDHIVFTVSNFRKRKEISSHPQGQIHCSLFVEMAGRTPIEESWAAEGSPEKCEGRRPETPAGDGVTSAENLNFVCP